MNASLSSLVLLLAIAQGDENQALDKLKSLAPLATVKVLQEGGKGLGSGVVIKREAGHVYILTAAHVVRPDGKFEIHRLVSSRPAKTKVYPGATVIAHNADADLAVLRLQSKEQWEVLPVCPTTKVAKTAPEMSLDVGWASGPMPSCNSGPVKRKVTLKRPGQQLAITYWETVRKPVAGRSGGPLLGTNGKVIGITSGHDDEFGYFVHIDEIHRFLKREALLWLAEESKLLPKGR